MITSREYRLKSWPNGAPLHENFELAVVQVPPPEAGEVQVRNRWMGMDPAMRGRMHQARSYVEHYQLGEPMEGSAIGEVTASNDPAFAAGDLVMSSLGWREFYNAPGSRLRKVDPKGLPLQALLGIAGSTGLTAYAGLVRIAEIKAGDVVFVSAAAGAVGSAACLIAKLKGCEVIGSAGGPDKVRFLQEELGIEKVIDYRAVHSVSRALAQAAPDGIDVYFDNVGGDHLEAAIARAKTFARFAICGMISAYNATEPPRAPANLLRMPSKRLKLQGFLLHDHMDLLPAFQQELAAWHAAGTLKWRETVFEGIERAPDAFLGLFTGANVGKTLVRLG